MQLKRLAFQFNLIKVLNIPSFEELKNFISDWNGIERVNGEWQFYTTGEASIELKPLGKLLNSGSYLIKLYARFSHPIEKLEVITDKGSAYLFLTPFGRYEGSINLLGKPEEFLIRLPQGLDGRIERMVIKKVGESKEVSGNFSTYTHSASAEPETKTICFFKPKDLRRPFFIDVANEREIAGWMKIIDEEEFLDVYINDIFVGKTRLEFDREDASSVYGKSKGFYFRIPEIITKEIMKNGEYKLKFLDEKGNNPSGGFFWIFAGDRLIEFLEKEITSQRESPLEDSKLIALKVLDFRKNINANYFYVFFVKDKTPKDETVDVIVPVYKGKEETLACLLSILNSKNETPYELIVINDNSPDVELTRELRNLQKEYKFILIENSENLGFVRSVNKGFEVHPNRDVIILNSDTLVPDFWIDRLKKAVYSENFIGTASPLSNRATILSIPIPNYPNDLPQGLTYKDMDEICKMTNDGVYVEIPTTVGFCMYIRRECLEEVGLFNHELFGKGYGEENDFCMRASALGWKHIAVCDLFVYHNESVSFGKEKEERIKDAIKTIEALYPDYHRRIQRFIRKDPLRKPRNRINVEILRRKENKPAFLYIFHNWGGGIEEHVKEMASLLKNEGFRVFTLQPDNEKLVYVLKEFQENDIFCEYEGVEDLAEDIKNLNVKHIHYHSVIGFKNDIWDLPKLLNVNYYVTIHDYYFICPTIHLINNENKYCNLPEETECEQCIKKLYLPYWVGDFFKLYFNSSINTWRKFYKEKLKQARKVFFPSKSALQVLNRYIPLDNAVIKPHVEQYDGEYIIKLSGNKEKLRIAVIGAIGPHKGYYKLRDIIKYSQERKLPFEFVIIGYTMNNGEIENFDNVKITGKYKKEELPFLINKYKPDIALFLSIVPETYSFTLTEALVNGLYPVALDIGAIAERIREYGVGKLIPPDASVEDICKVLNEIRELNFEAEIKFNNVYKSLVRDYYEMEEREWRN